MTEKTTNYSQNKKRTFQETGYSDYFQQKKKIKLNEKSNENNFSIDKYLFNNLIDVNSIVREDPLFFS